MYFLEPKCDFRLLPTVPYSSRDSAHPYSLAVGDFNSDGHMDIVVANFGFDNVSIFFGYGNNSFKDRETQSTGIGSAPRMVTVGHINNDSQSDIVVANFGTNNIVILYGNKDGSFSDQLSIDTSPCRPTYVVIGDFNGDGCSDIAFTGYGPNGVGILLRFGNDSFTAATYLSTGYDSFPYSIAIGDLNKDGWLDIAVANYGTDNVGIFFGNADGIFTSQTTHTTGTDSHPYSVAVGDLNNDTYLDIAVVNSNTNSIKILLGYGNGSFAASALYSTSRNSKPIFIAIGDFNDDNQLDITVLNNGNNIILLFCGRGDGTFANPIAYSTGPNSGPCSVAIVDFNSDNQLDVAIVNQQNNNVKIFNSYTDRKLRSEAIFPTSNNSSALGLSYISTGTLTEPSFLTTGDFNNDRLLDIVVSNNAAHNLGIFLGYGNGKFSPQTTYSTGADSYPQKTVAVDFNGDGQLDIAVANSRTDNIGIFLGYGNGEFSPMTTYSTGVGSRPTSIVAGDFNNDSRLDIAVTNSRTNNVGILLGYGNGEFLSQTTYFTGPNSGPTSIIAGDFNNDHRLDIAVVHYLTDKLGIFLGHGNGQFSSQLTYSTGTRSNAGGAIVADFNNDGRLDIAVANYGTSNVGIFLGYGNGEFSSQTTYYTGIGSRPISVVAGDFNKDGQLDIAVANYRTNNVGILLGYGNGEFSPQTTYFIGTAANLVRIIADDFNNDDRLDVSVAIINTGTIAVLLGDGAGHFPYVTRSPKMSFCSMLVAAGDFNNDRQLDIAAVNYDTNSVGIHLGYGNGSFEMKRILSTGNVSSPIAITVGDINNDGRLDIVVANYEGNNVGVFLGHGNGDFSSQTTYFTGINSSPMSAVVGDFNNDGQLDIAVANYGANSIGIFLGLTDGTSRFQTMYSIDNYDRPVSIAVADFNNDDLLDIAVASSGTNSIDILLGYGNGTFQSQNTLSIGLFSDPASLATGDFNNDNNTDIAVGNAQSKEEHVLILLGDGSGKFLDYGKYITEANSMLCSVVVGNFNNDNRLDIAIANNGTRSVGLFFGNGDGTFSSQTKYPTTENSNPISIAVGDFNNDNLTDLAVANFGTYTFGIFLAFIDTTFVDKSTWLTGSAASPGAVALSDFTHDNLLDIFVGNDGTHDIDIFINRGNGTFSIQTAYSGDPTFYPTFILVHDFDSDKHLDIVVANSVMDTVTLLSGEENGKFRNSTVFPTGINSHPRSMAIGDFNNDNRTDIVVVHSGTGSVSLLLRIDNGALTNLKTLSTGSNSKPHSLIVADFDNDGQSDIVVANRGNENIGFFFGRSNGSFSDQETFFLGEDIFPTWIGLGDFNNDKQLDVVITNSISPAPVIVLLGNGDRTFRFRKTNGFHPTNIGVVGDFNSDGYLDVVICQQLTDGIVVLLGYGNGTFRNPVIFSSRSNSSLSSVAVGDFNNDGSLDIVVAFLDKSNMGIFLGNGDGTFLARPDYFLSNYGPPMSLATGDFNNDHQVDIVVGFYNRNNLRIFFGYGNATFSTPITCSTGESFVTQWIDTGDMNNDGQLDIIIASSDSSNLGIILGRANGTFFDEITYTTGNSSYPYSVGLGDFNNDGRLDVAVSNMLSDNVGIFLGYISEDFMSVAPTPIDNSSQPVSIAVGNFDNDTYLDVVVADRGTNRIMILHGSSYGTFTTQRAYSTGIDSDPNWVAVNDFNRDQYSDIAVVNSGANNIGIFLGYGNGTFSNLATYSTGNFSSPVSLSVGYFNNDTHLDIVVANFGNNNVCLLFGYGDGRFASPECRTSGYDSRPYIVASGDVNGDKKTDIVIANRGSSTIEILTEIC